jgi:sn-glycerol 3-phosphate transport system substrate-binding protein
MRSWRSAAGAMALVLSAAGLVATGTTASAAAASVKCPKGAIAKASKPVQITMWHSMTRANADTLQKLVDQFNSSQTDVRVTLVNQVDYDATFAKYKAGLSSGDLPDIVQLQETDQQQVIDTGTVLPAGACAKVDKYSFSDFLPRVVSYYTVRGQQYAMPFNTSGPVLYYNKKAFQAAGLDPNKPPSTLDEVRTDSQKLKSSGAVSKAGIGLKLDPGFFEHFLAKAGKLFVNNSNGRKARATKTVFDNSAGLQIFQWMSGMVKDGLAQTNPDTGPSAFDDLLGIGNGSFAMAIDTSASLGTITQVLGSGSYPNVDLGVAPMPGPSGKGGVLVSGGALYMVNKSRPEKQEAAWRFLKFLDDTAQQATWATGTGYVPIRKSTASSQVMQDFWAKNPYYKVAYDQLLSGSNDAASSGSVIGDYVGVRNAMRDAENTMFLEGKSPADALKGAASSADTVIQDYNSRVGG